MNMDRHWASRRFFFAWTVVCLLFEIEASFLFLWPLNHSCSKPYEGNLSLATDVDSSGQPINPDAIQTNLVDASGEDPETLARGLSMGFAYDDIAHCLEYPVEYRNTTTATSTINYESLETCRYGLKFELIPEYNLSVTSHFKLACSRQWLKLLLNQSICVGFLVGFILHYCINLKRPLTSEVSGKFNSRLKPANSNSYKCGHEETRKEFLFWCLMQSLVILFAQLSSTLLDKEILRSTSESPHNNINHVMGERSINVMTEDVNNDLDYFCLIVCVMLRITMISSIMKRILIDWSCPSNLHFNHQSSSAKLWENHLLFIITVVIFILCEALCFPLATRVFYQWITLNQFLTDFSSLLIIVAFLYEFFILKYNMLTYTNKGITSLAKGGNVELKEVEKLESYRESLYETDSSLAQDVAKDVIEADKFINKVENQRGRFMEPSSFFVSTNNEPPSVKVCDFCLVMNEQTICSAKGKMMTMTAPMNHAHMSDQQQRQSDDDIIIKLDDSSVVDFDAYQPTTVSIDDCLINNENSNNTDSNLVMMPTNALSSSQIQIQTQTLSLSRLSQPQTQAPQQPRHNLGQINTSLLRWPILIQLWLLTFCVSFNFFILKMIPNHKMIHSESMASKYARKVSHHDKLMSNYGLTNHPIEWFHNDKVFAQEKDNNYTLISYGNFSYHNNEKHQNGHRRGAEMNKELLFDYTSVNYASIVFDILSKSNNPFAIIWTTAELNQWPIVLLILILHSSRFSKFESIYFKQKRLFTLVHLGSQGFVIEWILIALVRRQNHLLEVEWLRWISVLVAKFCASLMAYNYFHNMLKLSRKLNSDSLLKYEPNIICTLMALSLASLAPMMERLDLAIIPTILTINNLLSYFISKNLSNRFQRCLCPMMFDDDE